MAPPSAAWTLHRQWVTPRRKKPERSWNYLATGGLGEVEKFHHAWGHESHSLGSLRNRAESSDQEYMENPIRCAVIGLGRIGSTLEKDPLREKPASHAGAIRHHPETLLTAGADPNPDRREDFESDWPGVRTYADSLKMIKRERPRILHIASWTETHPEILDKALREQIPIIVCEKPLADSLRAVRRSLVAAHRSKTRIVMNHERRFSADYRYVRRSIDDRSLGDLLSINARLYMGRTRPAKQALYHDGTHMIDILRYLTGGELTIKHVRGKPLTAGGGLEILGHVSDSVLFWEISGGRDHLVFELDLSFARGRIRIGNGVFEVWDSEESPYYSGFRSLKKIKHEWMGETGYFAGMMDHAVALAKDPERVSESSVDDGYRVLKTIRCILKHV